MIESILEDVKHALNLDKDYTAFDSDIIMHINTVLSDLEQISVGPNAGFFITGYDETWVMFVGADPRLNRVKSYIYMRVRMMFDPSGSSYVLDSFRQQIKELEWRLSVQAEGAKWVPPESAATVTSSGTMGSTE